MLLISVARVLQKRIVSECILRREGKQERQQDMTVFPRCDGSTVSFASFLIVTHIK